MSLTFSGFLVFIRIWIRVRVIISRLFRDIRLGLRRESSNLVLFWCRLRDLRSCRGGGFFLGATFGILLVDFESLLGDRDLALLGFSKRETRQIWGIWKLRLAYSPETPNLGQNRWCFVPCDLEIWRMTLENDRASLLCCFKLCATFHSHWWIQTGVTVRKRPFWVKFYDF